MHWAGNGAYVSFWSRYETLGVNGERGGNAVSQCQPIGSPKNPGRFKQ